MLSGTRARILAKCPALLVVAPLLVALCAQPAAAAPAKRAMLPDRLLRCEVRHITNFNEHLEQTAAELTYDSVNPLVLFLPAVPVRTTPPPAAFQKLEPVNPRTRILADPAGIAPQPTHRFNNVVDYWPDRVELTSVIAGKLLNAIVINPIDTTRNTANFFMTRATELTHYDRNAIFQGGCSVLLGEEARKAARAYAKPG